MSEFMCINDRIEPLYSYNKSAAAATQVAFQQPVRAEELDKGAVNAVSGDEVLRKARALIK